MTRERLIIVWLGAALLLGLLLIGGYRLPTGAVGAGRGKPRDVPMELLQRRIQERRLSDREALFYKKLGEGGEAGASSRPPSQTNR